MRPSRPPQGPLPPFALIDQRIGACAGGQLEERSLAYSLAADTRRQLHRELPQLVSRFVDARILPQRLDRLLEREGIASGELLEPHGRCA